MLAIYLSPIYILLNLYIMRWLIWWMSACSRHFKKKWVRAAVIVIYAFLRSLFSQVFCCRSERRSAS